MTIVRRFCAPLPLAAVLVGTAIATLAGPADRRGVSGLHAAAAQVAGLRAQHRDGQTFITWTEVEPAFASHSASVADIDAFRQQLARRRIAYRIYRSDHPIDSLSGQRPTAEVPPLSAWNTEYVGNNPGSRAEAWRYAIEDGAAPLPVGTGVYVHRVERGGPAFYAVTVTIDGQENQILDAGNLLRTPVVESVGAAPPILQRTVHPPVFQYVERPTLHYFVRWESPPAASVQSMPFDYLVAVPPGAPRRPSAGLHLHSWGGSLNDGFGWWFNAEKGAVLLSTNEKPYDWWTGYHERLFTSSPPRSAVEWQQGVVRPYTQRRLLSFLDWATGRFDLDRDRIFGAGLSMGGSGSIMLGLRHPDRFAWVVSWVGVHRPRLSPTFRSSYEQVYGRPEWEVKFEDGTPVWDYFDDAQYLLKHPELDTPFITFSNGRNDAGIGWPQAVDFYRALQATRRPHMFVWGVDGHGQRARMPAGGGERVMPVDLRIAQSVPAFTRGSLDDEPGNGDPADGTPRGQANAYLYWGTEDIRDEPDRWEMTIGVHDSAPAPRGTVDVTPRRCQQFRPKPGERFAWSAGPGRGTPRQSGEVVADKYGLVTIEGVAVDKGGTRLRIARASAP